jgi:ATP-binding cassette, subfamily B, bacterial
LAAGQARWWSSLLPRARQPVVILRAGWRRVRPLVAGNRLAVAVLAGASIGAGLAEAAVLVLVADVAAAMVLQGHHVSTTQQTAGLDLSIGAALLVALALAAVRLFLQLLVAWLPARITAEVQADLRVELFDAFTRASWATQADES